MTHQCFNRLPAEQKLEKIWQDGCLLTRVRYGNQVYKLYALNYFFVEVSFCQGNNSTLSIKGFTETARLDLFLETVTITL